MKRFLPLALVLAPTMLFAEQPDEAVVQWKQVVGVITAPNINNPVAGIASGAGPWSVTEGHARVNLVTGQASFEVHGLVLNGSNSSGTPGPVNSVTGTLVCNPGEASQVVLDTQEVRLTAEGDARFRGEISAIPGVCANPVFLVRIGPSFPNRGAVGRWLGTGAVRSIGETD